MPLFLVFRDKLVACLGFAWDRADFLPSDWSSAVLWPQCEKNVDTPLMLWLLPSNVYTESRTFQPEGWGCTRSCEETRPGEWAQTAQSDAPCYVTSCSGIKSALEEEEQGWGLFWCSVPLFFVCAFLFVCFLLKWLLFKDWLGIGMSVGGHE